MRVTLAALLLCALAAGRAEAYPQFQFSTGNTRCNLCHFAPAGGGLLNGYGRDEAGDTISRGGDGGLLHGAWDPPSWLALGGDFRVAGLYNDNGSTEGAIGEEARAPELLFIPMQADLYGRFAFGSISVNLIAGLRGRARPRPGLDVLDYLVSREHWVQWRPKSTGPYVRAGRFFAPYGLRLVDHTAYVRRHLGFHTLEETLSLSAGYLKDEWEAHLTAFTPALFQRVGHDGSGAAIYYERRLGDTRAVGGQARVAIGSADSRMTAGAVGKWWLAGPELLLLGEVDAVRQSFDGDGLPGRTQLAAYLGATWFPTRGLMVTGALERFDADLAVKDIARDSVSATVQYFPLAHLEIALLARLQLISGELADQALLQVHYYP